VAAQVEMDGRPAPTGGEWSSAGSVSVSLSDPNPSQLIAGVPDGYNLCTGTYGLLVWACPVGLSWPVEFVGGVIRCCQKTTAVPRTITLAVATRFLRRTPRGRPGAARAFSAASSILLAASSAS